MKIASQILITLIVLIIFSCRDPSKNAQKKSKTDINDCINKYDPILSSIQYYYRIWLEDENKTYYNNVDLIDPQKIKNLSYIDDNIDHLINSIDTVKSYLKDLAYVGAEYGKNLKFAIKDNNVQIDFQSKWREYQESLTKVMAYDIERINRFMNIFIFLRDNQSNFEVKNDMIYFLNDATLHEFNKLTDMLSDKKLNANQEQTRITTLNLFLDALSLAKENS